MSYLNPQPLSLSKQQKKLAHKSLWEWLHLDPILLIGLVVLSCAGLIILYSAANQNTTLLYRQILRFGLGFFVMYACAQISPTHLRRWAPWIFSVGLALLLAVLIMGAVSKGAQRWLNLGFIRFQPSEIMKLAIPLMLAWYLNDKPLPPSHRVLIGSSLLILIPVFITLKQPDLGTALMLTCSGTMILLLAGMSWRLVSGLVILTTAATPILWYFMHEYQRQRVLTLLNPERDPLGHGYHIIQSKIAIGSGGIFGKGWLSGTQSHLNFLPEHATDFIFAVLSEEFGLIGCLTLLLIYGFVIFRGLYISTQAQDTFGRLLAGSISLTFLFSIFVNIGMVIGILPVVGIPLPLVSYGGTSIVTLFAGFGILMSIHTHKKLLAS